MDMPDRKRLHLSVAKRRIGVDATAFLERNVELERLQVPKTVSRNTREKGEENTDYRVLGRQEASERSLEARNRGPGPFHFHKRLFFLRGMSSRRSKT
jgi:hypothetical protein